MNFGVKTPVFPTFHSIKVTFASLTLSPLTLKAIECLGFPSVTLMYGVFAKITRPSISNKELFFISLNKFERDFCVRNSEAASREIVLKLTN